MITVLVVRDPDGGDDIQIWDGDDDITSSCFVTVVDAGRGYDYDDWIEMAAGDVASVPHQVPRDAITVAYLDPPGNKFITGWPDD
jgi:hypothetical protein